MGSTAGTESTVEQAMTDFNEALHMFDPFRFRAWAELGLTTAQLRVMFLLRENPGVTAGELAARLSVTPPTISGIVDRLVRLGLVRREDDPADRRLVRNFLTEQGENNCGRLARGGELFTRRIMVEMDQKDLEALIRGLRAFINASHYVSQVQPNLAEVAMHGGGRG
jgi:DNA-binding MarR family transcriptional regulator